MARRRASREALGIAREHFEIRQQVVRPEHGLRAARVRVAGNDGVGIARGQIQQRLHHARQQHAHAVALVAQPQAQIERDLLVAAAPGVDLVGHRAGMLLQLADDQGVDVFIGGAVEELGLGGFLAYLVESFDDAGALGGGENAGLFQRACEGLRAAYIRADQAPVEIQRSGEAFEDLRRARFKPAAPELHAASAQCRLVFAKMECAWGNRGAGPWPAHGGPAPDIRPEEDGRAERPPQAERLPHNRVASGENKRPASAARTLIGNPMRLMNPNASFWS